METLFPIGLPAAGIAWATATGGTVTEPGDGYRYHTFTANGTLTVISPGLLEYLIVAGGAGGAAGTSSRANGSGGAGVLLTNDGQADHTVTVQGYPIVVGFGGTGGSGGKGGAGGNSSFDGLTTIGGGAGGYTNEDGDNGGCGGGACDTTTSSVFLGGTGSPGGDGGDTSPGATAGGGAGGGPGGDANLRTPGPGLDVWGTTYGAGGPDPKGLGAGVPRVDEPANSGNGGRAGYNNAGGAGGSGKVIIRYAI